MQGFARFAAVLAAGLTLASGGALAGPPEVVAALQGTPATLFDLTLARLEALVMADGNVNGYSAFVNYQDDQIMIWTWSLEAPSSDEACKAMLDRVKRLASVDPETGFPDDPTSRFASFFSYPSIDAFAIDPTYEETVDSMFHLRGVIGISGDGKAVICDSMLLSKDTSFSRD